MPDKQNRTFYVLPSNPSEPKIFRAMMEKRNLISPGLLECRLCGARYLSGCVDTSAKGCPSCPAWAIIHWAGGGPGPDDEDTVECSKCGYVVSLPEWRETWDRWERDRCPHCPQPEPEEIVVTCIGLEDE